MIVHYNRYILNNPQIASSATANKTFSNIFFLVLSVKQAYLAEGGSIDEASPDLVTHL